MKLLKYFYECLVQLSSRIALFLRFISIDFEDSSSLKPDRINGQGFLRWQEQIKAWLIYLDLLTALGKSLSFESFSLSKDYKSFEEINYYCRFRRLSCLSDKLYEIYRNFKTLKEL